MFPNEIKLIKKENHFLNFESNYHSISDSCNRYVMVFNGEIYNLTDLRRELEETGVVLKSGSDAEVLIELYALEQEKVLHRLRGMFAFVILDRKAKSIFAATDIFGIMPLYFTETENGIAFSLEEKDLFPSGKKTISLRALQNYLTFQYVPDERGLLREVQQLKPGHYLFKEVGKEPLITQYYALEFKPDRNQSFKVSVRRTREVLEDSVKKHIPTDVSVGAFLSGGIDSTCIVALAKRYHPSIKTFTVGFERDGYNEIKLAEETADYLGVENIQKVITPDEVLQELPRIIWLLGAPVADPAAIPNYFVAKEASKHTQVVFSGEGADELFGGYNIYREPLALKVFDYLPVFLKKALHHIARIFPEGIKGRSFILRGTTPLSERYVGNAKIFNEEEKKILLNSYSEDFAFAHMTKKLYQSGAHYDPITQMQYIDLHTWLPGDILTITSRMAMAHSLELRVPFLDKEVFEVARTLPADSKISHGTTKYVLRQAVKDLVPESVTTRRKLGFPVPISHWLKNELYEWAIQTIKNSPIDHLLNKQEIDKLMNQHVSGRHDHSRKIWTILTFMIWYDLYIEEKYEEHLLSKSPSLMNSFWTVPKESLI